MPESRLVDSCVPTHHSWISPPDDITKCEAKSTGETPQQRNISNWTISQIYNGFFVFLKPPMWKFPANNLLFKQRKLSPKIKCSSVSGSETPSKVWLKLWPKVKDRRFGGKFTFCRLWLKWRSKVSDLIHCMVCLQDAGESWKSIMQSVAHPQVQTSSITSIIYHALSCGLFSCANLKNLIPTFPTLIPLVASPRRRSPGYWRLLGHATPSMLQLKWVPRTNSSRASGNCTWGASRRCPSEKGHRSTIIDELHVKNGACLTI